ncbi:MAG: 4'-phosphopantetheinyl transferase superfamily protein [Candidatus Acidiferrum sp.]
MNDYSSCAFPWNKLSLAPNETHVWRVRLDVGADALRRAAECLSADENARAERFRFLRDREHFIIAHATLRNLLGGFLAYPPTKICLIQGPYGKPSLSGDFSGNPLRFNISHSHGWALLAFAYGREVGIDIEKIRPEIVTEDIAERYFSVTERNELLSLPAEIRAEAFFLCWTRKEAYIKAHGTGLQFPLDSFDVSLDPREPAILRGKDSERWDLCSLRPTSGHAGALISEKSIGVLCLWDHSEWL